MPDDDEKGDRDAPEASCREIARRLGLHHSAVSKALYGQESGRGRSDGVIRRIWRRQVWGDRELDAALKALMRRA